ncbi:vitamin B12 transporter [Tenacibaculum sp. MAR_2009_124]|uniref:TonB-dependent receptor plug domain-containing protein n=1 Tax=Tenacibaculum sp. MAR_2009_124 TaxID=1250059 RepID=UPI00089A628B|nr:TonB-dependent receptor [Tenacibaculum sp. MAR_2009_124]SEB54810.1 vitamin B12 transporter [Tenacibaculum sp. MAR_2009_124]
MKKKVLYLSVLTSMFALSNYAQEKVKNVELDEVVISDSKFKLKKENSGKVIHKITPKIIENNSGRSVVDIINNIAGIEINGNTSSPGKNIDLFIRGGRSKEVVILIDGIQVSDPGNFSGGFDLRYLDLNNLESIEIIKGAASTLYGTGAATAVINIKLKEATSGNTNVALSLFGGTNNDQVTNNGTSIQSSANVKGKIKNFDYLVNFSSFDARGTSSARSEDGTTFADDPFQRISTNAKLGYKFSEKFSTKIFGSYSEFNNSFDAGAFTNGANNTLDKSYRLSVSPEYIYGKGSVQVNAAYSKYDANRESTSFPATMESENYIVDAFIKHQFDKFYVVVGVNFQYNEIIEAYNIPWGESELTRVSYSESPITRLIDPYLNAVYISGYGLNVNAGVRLNNHNKYGNHFVYNVNPSYRIKLPEGYVKFLGSYSTAFLAPTIQNLYDVQYGNVDLEPQESTTIEGGIEYKYGSLVLNTVYFNRDVENIIGFDSNTFQSINQGAAKIQGIEFNADYNILKNLTVNANYTYTDNEELAVRIPKHKINAGLNYGLKNSNFGLTYQYVSDRDDTDFRSFPSVNVPLEAYSLLNFSANHELNKNVKLFLAVTNIFNEDYQEVFGFTTLGRNYNLGVRLNF